MGHFIIFSQCAKVAKRLTVWLLLLSVIHISVVLPNTAYAFFGAFTIKDEVELGKKFNVLIKSRLPIVQDPEVDGYINDMVARIAKSLPPQPFPFTTSVVRHNAVNAFASPGGYLFIYTGLILAMDSESDLAGVVSHEMAHVTQRHIAGRIENSQLVSILSIAGALAGAFLGGESGSAMMHGSLAAGQSAMLGYSRGDESDADQVGMSYLTKAGYSPQGMVQAFKVLGKKQWLMGSDIPTYLTTHPGIEDRVNTMSTRVSSMPAELRNRKDNNTRFKRIQTLIRAKYSDVDVANIYFINELKSGDNALVRMGQGILWARQNKVQDATKAFDTALSLAPTEQLIMREAGMFHYTKGNKEKGISLLKKSLELKPKDTMALFYLSQVLADQGNYTQAIEYTRNILRTVPEDVEVHEMIGRYYGQNNQLFKAYLHLSYAALYANNRQKVKQLAEKTKGYAKTAAEKADMKRFDDTYKERKDFW